MEDDDDHSVRHDRLKQGDYVLVKFQGLKNTPHFVARVDDNSLSDTLKRRLHILSRNRLGLHSMMNKVFDL